MNTPDQPAIAAFSAAITARWVGRTLADFRKESEATSEGLIWETVTAGDMAGVIVCATGKEWLALLGPKLAIPQDEPSADWATTTLADIALCTMRMGEMSCQDARDASNRLSALVLCAMDPRSNATLRGALSIPS